uniref:Dit-like phage tail protein N-terminal domain-containing protein n=1 Tax=Vibrio phage P018-4 TaxID=3229728 RepID=A0AB39AJ92_9CAUD
MDAIVSLVPVYTSTPTKYSISDKSVISNHVVKNNPTLSLTGFVGRHPIKSYSDSIVGYADLEQRPISTHDKLLEWFQNSTKLFIYSEFFQFNGYVVTSYQPKQLDVTDTLQFDLQLEYIRHVSYERGTLLEFADTTKTVDGKSKTSSSGSEKKVEEDRGWFEISRQIFEFYSDNGILDGQGGNNDN